MGLQQQSSYRSISSCVVITWRRHRHSVSGLPREPPEGSSHQAPPKLFSVLPKTWCLCMARPYARFASVISTRIRSATKACKTIVHTRRPNPRLPWDPPSRGFPNWRMELARHSGSAALRVRTFGQRGRLERLIVATGFAVIVIYVHTYI